MIDGRIVFDGDHGRIGRDLDHGDPEGAVMTSLLLTGIGELVTNDPHDTDLLGIVATRRWSSRATGSPGPDAAPRHPPPTRPSTSAAAR